MRSGALGARRRADQRRNRPRIRRKQAGRMGGKCVMSTCGRRRRSGHCLSARGALGGCAPSIKNDVRQFGLWGKLGGMVCAACLPALWGLFGCLGGRAAGGRRHPPDPPLHVILLGRQVRPTAHVPAPGRGFHAGECHVLMARSQNRAENGGLSLGRDRPLSPPALRPEGRRRQAFLIAGRSATGGRSASGPAHTSTSRRPCRAPMSTTRRDPGN